MMNNEISTDVITDPDFKEATTVWSACMARNVYTTSDADAFALNELSVIGLRSIAPRTVGGLDQIHRVTDSRWDGRSAESCRQGTGWPSPSAAEL